MSGNDWVEVVATVGAFALVITIVTVIIVQVAAIVRSRAAVAREEAYRKLAERAVGTQEQLDKRLAALDEQLGDARSRIAAIEQILKQVE